MEAQLASPDRDFVCQSIEPPAPSTDRERRRIEFRSSLLKARAAFARADGRQIAIESMRQLSAGLMEHRPARRMAELANAH